MGLRFPMRGTATTIIAALVGAWVANASAAEDPTQWLSGLPTVATVQKAIQGADSADTALRQDAAFAVLTNFILEYGGMKRAPIAGPRYGEYQSQIHGNVYKTNKYVRSPDFIASVISTLISPEAARSYQGGMTYHQLVGPAGNTSAASSSASPAPAPAPAPQWVQTDVAQAHDHHSDLTVFGITLGEQLNLPRCSDKPDSNALLSGLVGIGRGGAETCVGNSGGNMAIMVGQVVAGLAGVRPAPDDTDQASVGLADARCPVWLKTAGNCTLFLRGKDGFVLSLVMTPGTDADAQRLALAELVRKYGPADPGGPAAQCTAPITAQGYGTDGTFVTAQVGSRNHEATGHVWSRVPGLYVSYLPIAGDCRGGLIEVDLAGYHQSRVATRARDAAAEPKM
jgi:hypothetical protein